jgi:hypothetical protein
VPVSRCEACPFAGPKVRETARDGFVDCGRSILPIAGNATDTSFPPAVAAALPVGLALVRSIVCAEDNLPWVELARERMLTGSPCDVPIVDRGGALVGILPAAAMALAGRDAPVDRVASVADLTVSSASVHETESLGAAFAAMGVRHVRELTVVGDGLLVVGVLRDVDALRFVAYVARTGNRPASECAA